MPSTADHTDTLHPLRGAAAIAALQRGVPPARPSMTGRRFDEPEAYGYAQGWNACRAEMLTALEAGQSGEEELIAWWWQRLPHMDPHAAAMCEELLRSLGKLAATPQQPTGRSGKAVAQMVAGGDIERLPAGRGLPPGTKLYAAAPQQPPPVGVTDAWHPITDSQPPVGKMDPWLVADETGDYMALARRSTLGWRVDGAGDWKLPFVPAQYCKPPIASHQQPAPSDAGKVAPAVSEGWGPSYKQPWHAQEDAAPVSESPPEVWHSKYDEPPGL